MNARVFIPVHLCKYTSSISYCRDIENNVGAPWD